MKNLIDIIAVTALIIGLTILFGFIFGIVFPIILLFFFFYWVLGGKITVTINEEKAGYVRWFKFYKN